MKRNLLFLTAVLVAGLFVSCRKDASEVFIVAYPNEAEILSGSSFYFDVESHSLHSTLKNIIYSSFDAVSGKSELGSDELDVKDYYGKFYCIAPEVSDTMSVVYSFNAQDALGFSNTYERKILVLPIAKEPVPEPGTNE